MKERLVKKDLLHVATIVSIHRFKNRRGRIVVDLFLLYFYFCFILLDFFSFGCEGEVLTSRVSN